ncbi:uncharacterized protein B4U80_01466, partial [Leptotrombidium deliense]
LFIDVFSQKVNYNDYMLMMTALNIRQLAALAFVPVDHIQSSFTILLDSPFFRNNQLALMSILDYFESTWIGRTIRVKYTTSSES